ncbi:MAG: YbaB/EbfC family nucleoid-associated protein [Oscillospiraceae bacterium]|jgi:DNA-binding YbaB/EbfC family protein|nr:YbaB/EbfC family nucleoid-associated protein [Oscillospiraceae bacterium]
MKARLPEAYQNKGAGSMNGMIKQAQKMQEDVKALREELNKREYEVTAGGGLIKLSMTGDKTLKSVKLDPDIVSKDEIEDLEDVIVAGVNAIIAKIDEECAAEMEKVTGGMNLPAMM